MWVDPEAAAIMLGSGAPLRLVGLDVTVQVRLTREHARRMAAGGRALGAFAGTATQDWIHHTERTRPGDLSEHGSCGMATAVDVEAFTELFLERVSAL